MIAYESEVNGGESHVALVHGALCDQGEHWDCSDCPKASDAVDGSKPTTRPVLVRVHTRCTAGDIFASDCNCREVLDQSMRMIVEAGCGALLYLHNTSRGFEIDATPKIKGDSAKLLLHGDLRAIEAHEDRHKRIVRAVGLGGQILFDLGIRRIRLLSNTPMHIPALEGFGLEIVEQVPIPIASHPHVCLENA
jgi:3,4-dihydroxy 2-butanone 4-phosphate synthase/GTP cyclohydrolase II